MASAGLPEAPQGPDRAAVPEGRRAIDGGSAAFASDRGTTLPSLYLLCDRASSSFVLARISPSSSPVTVVQQLAECPIPEPVPRFDDHWEHEYIFGLRATSKRTALFAIENIPLFYVAVETDPRFSVRAVAVHPRTYCHRTVPCPAFAAVTKQIRRQQESRVLIN
jgi:hypothetical protein